MSSKSAYAELLVEGKNDQHVIWALCQIHQVPEQFVVTTPEDDIGGIDALLAGISLRLQIDELEILGIVVDADESPQSRWDSIRNILRNFGYQHVPKTPDSAGMIITDSFLPKVGVWIMPNNQVPGMLEDFVAHLIPSQDQLIQVADNVLQDIESRGLHQYSISHHAKARIHT